MGTKTTTDIFARESAPQYPAELCGWSTSLVGQAVGSTDQPLSACQGSTGKCNRGDHSSRLCKVVIVRIKGGGCYIAIQVLEGHHEWVQ